MVEENKIEQNRSMEKIKERILHPTATSLSLKRVPIPTADLFKKYANDEFVGDYGLCLKKLVDMVLVDGGIYSQFQDILADHEERISKLESPQTPKPKFKVRKTISGREIKVPVKE